MHSINDACLIARVTFEDPLEVHRLWRYLNMLHAAAYCGMTEELSETNFLMPLCDKYGLLSVGEVYEEEISELKRIKIDESGSRACAMFEVWAFQVIRGEAERYEKTKKGIFAPPLHTRLQGEVNNISVSIKRLFAYRYQVLPYIYTHLVSLSCAVYLLSLAFLMGAKFNPEASRLLGLVFPFLYVVIQIVTTFGLIEVRLPQPTHPPARGLPICLPSTCPYMPAFRPLAVGCLAVGAGAGPECTRRRCSAPSTPGHRRAHMPPQPHMPYAICHPRVHVPTRCPLCTADADDRLSAPVVPLAGRRDNPRPIWERSGGLCAAALC